MKVYCEVLIALLGIWLGVSGVTILVESRDGFTRVIDLKSVAFGLFILVVMVGLLTWAANL